MNGKILFKSNVTALGKVLAKLDYSQDMSNSQKILGETNQKKLMEAADLVRKAMQVLNTIS